MKNFNCQALKHTGMWSTLPQSQVLAFAGKSIPSIRGSEYNDPRITGSFIESEKIPRI
jgi:hypothetical protein